MQNCLSFEDILQGFKNLPISKNPVILVHSSFKSFGCVEGGPSTVIKALQHIAEKEGTIVVPTLTYGSVDESAPCFDVRNTPSECGIITETLRRLPEARRSLHVVASASAIGEKAEYITSFHHDTPCGKGSPYQKIIELDGYVLFLGATFGSNTLFHVAEEYVSPHYMKYKSIENARITGYDGNVRIHTFQRYNCSQTGVIRKLGKMEEVFRSEGVLHESYIGKSRITLIKASDNFSISCKILKDNPDFILD